MQNILFKKRFLALSIALLLFFSLLLFFFNHRIAIAPIDQSYGDGILKIGGEDISVEIADTPEEQTRGLSGRKSMEKNQGMLFIFDNSGKYSFWMKEMSFSLDFIWISGNMVVEVTQNVKPEDYQPPKVLIPKNKIDKVLEVSAGTAGRLGIKEGDKIEF